jgi:RHS repeat-associated protein
VSGVFLPGTKPVGTCLRHDALSRLVLAGAAASPGAATPGGLGCTSDGEVATVSARFKYDHLNRRIARLDAAGTTRFFVHDPTGLLLSETQKPTSVTRPWTRQRDYVWLDGRPLAQIEYPGPSGSAGGYVFYYHPDQLGLPRALTSQAGQTVWSATADPYGGVTETTIRDPISRRTVVTNLRLPGQYDERLLGSVGLQGPYYNWNRWYLPSVGRYMELDPIALRGRFNSRYGVNWYGYAAANPMRYVDPRGLYDCFYSISTHHLVCTPNDPSNPSFDSDDYVAGQNSPTCPDCQNNPSRVNVPDFGPIPPRPYKIGDRLTPGGHRRRLTPNPSNGRWGFQTHGCGNPNTCSNGCVAATDNNTRDLFDDLMDLEDNNTLVVEP